MCLKYKRYMYSYLRYDTWIYEYTSNFVTKNDAPVMLCCYGTLFTSKGCHVNTIPEFCSINYCFGLVFKVEFGSIVYFRVHAISYSCLTSTETPTLVAG